MKEKQVDKCRWIEKQASEQEDKKKQKQSLQVNYNLSDYGNVMACSKKRHETIFVVVMWLERANLFDCFSSRGNNFRWKISIIRVLEKNYRKTAQICGKLCSNYSKYAKYALTNRTHSTGKFFDSWRSFRMTLFRTLQKNMLKLKNQSPADYVVSRPATQLHFICILWKN